MQIQPQEADEVRTSALRGFSQAHKPTRIPPYPYILAVYRIFAAGAREIIRTGLRAPQQKGLNESSTGGLVA